MVIRLAILALLAAVAPTSGTASPPVTTAATAAAVISGTAAPPGPQWVGTWTAAQVAPARTGLSHLGFKDQTVRDMVHISVGGSAVRIRISNVFGTRPLQIADVRVALRGNGALLMAGTSHRVTFRGKDLVTIPAGQREFSDAVPLRVSAGQNLAVSIFVKSATGPATWHPDAVASSYYSTAGDHSAAAGAAAYPHRIGAWYFLDGVDVVNPAINGAVVAFGASTSDGVGSTVDANLRYPDDLARQLLGLPSGVRLSVLNAGISGNQLLASGGTGGQSGLSRFARDALNQTGARVVIVWEGTNDIGDHATMTARQITDGYLRLIAAAHARGITVIGATLQPDEGAGYYSARGNRVREEVNRWIRSSGAFDAVADFDAVLRDPSDPVQMLPRYDSGDHLHPDNAGYQAIADSIDAWTLAGLAIGFLPAMAEHRFVRNE